MSSVNCVYDNSILGNGFVFYKRDGYRNIEKLVKFCINTFSSDLEYVIFAKDNDYDIEENKIKTIELIIEQDSIIYLPLLKLYHQIPEENKVLYSSLYNEELVKLTKYEDKLIISATKVVNNPVYLGNDRFSIIMRNTPHLSYLKEFYNDLRELNLEEEYFFPKMRVKTNY